MRPLPEALLIGGIVALFVACAAPGPAADAGLRDLASSDLASSDGPPRDLPPIDAGSDAALARVGSLTRATNLACADPSIDRDDALYYVVCTGRSTRYYTSRDLVTWEGHDMSIAFPSWADAGGGVWAYELERVEGRWYLYFSAPDRTNPAASGLHRSIGVVETDALVPGARFTTPPSLGDGPLVRRDGHSLIDPFVFQAPTGGLFIYYNQYDPTKADSGIYVNRLADPVTKECCATALLGASAADTPMPRAAAWTGTTLEAPAVFARGDAYYLLFSGNLYDGDRYAIGVARADAPTGPFREAPDDPVLGCARMRGSFGGACLMGPGGASVAPDGALVFHARMATDSGRWLYAGHLGVDPSGWVTID